ncbi:porin [Alicycliphilus denitrificans]|uniref:porin n=1 Tax=Alicycliphilus denitrificans TaxID=179636 RepID=UPI000C9F2B65|nr:porin [Alicycliphilus denitrificans]
MKKTIALAAGLAGMALSPAFAQSSVTLYGLMDAGLVHIDNVGGASSNQVRSGSALTSRFGLRGSEDLGGGLSAIFNLESGIWADTGAIHGDFFQRQSWIGLRSASFGEVTAGRLLPSISDVLIGSTQAPYLGNPTATIDGAATAGASARFNNMLGTRVSNAIKYASPSFSGFKVHALTAFGEVAGSNSAGRVLSLGGSYVSDSIEAGLVYHETQCKDAGGCAPGKAKDKILGLGGSYKLNGARYGAVYTRQENALNVQGNDADVFTMYARVPLSPQWIVMGGLQFQNDKSVQNYDVRQVNLGANYVLSKRTWLYALYSHQTVKNGGKAGMYSATSDSDKQNQFSTGVVHTF